MPEPYRDRSRRLAACGILLIAAGATGLLLALAHLLLPLAAEMLPSAPVAGDRVAILIGAFVYGSFGAGLVWIGAGSVRQARWVRPLVLSLAWIWLITGLMALPLAAGLLDDAILVATAEMASWPAGLLTAVQAVLLALLAMGGVAFPALLIWAYRDPDVGRTCEAAHPAPAWTDRCPLPVLGLSVCLGLYAWIALPAAARPAVPLFGRLLTGWPASLLVLGSAVGAAGLAWWSYRLRPAGWWGTTLALGVSGVSASITFAAVEPRELYRALGYPDEVLAAWSGSPLSGRPVLVASTVALTLLSLVYMARIRRHFAVTPGACAESAPSSGRNRSGSPRSENRAPRSP